MMKEDEIQKFEVKSEFPLDDKARLIDELFRENLKNDLEVVKPMSSLIGNIHYHDCLKNLRTEMELERKTRKLTDEESMIRDRRNKMEKQWERGELYEVLVHGRKVPDNPDIDRIAGFVAGLTIGGKTISQSELEAAVGEVFSSKWLNYVKSLRKTERPEVRLNYSKASDCYHIEDQDGRVLARIIPYDQDNPIEPTEMVNAYNFMVSIAAGEFYAECVGKDRADKVLKGRRDRAKKEEE